MDCYCYCDDCQPLTDDQIAAMRRHTFEYTEAGLSVLDNTTGVRHQIQLAYV